MYSSTNNRYKWVAASAGILLVGFLVWYFHTIVFYILGAAAVSLIGKPLVRMIERVSIAGRTIPRWASAAVVLITLLTVFITVFSFLIPIIVEKLSYLSSIESYEMLAAIKVASADFEHTLNSIFPVIDISIEELFREHVAPIFKSGVVTDIVEGLAGFVSEIFMATFSISFIAYFFLKDDKLFDSAITTLFPKRYERNIQHAIKSSVNLLGRYFIGICLESFIKFIVVTLALYLLGIDITTAVIIGSVTAVLNVIPYIGPLIGVLASYAIAMLSPSLAAASIGELIFEITVVLAIFQLIDNIILQPYIYSSSVKAHPLEIFIVILMAGYAGGVLGMLLAIPFYTVLRVFAKEFFANLRVVKKLTENL